MNRCAHFGQQALATPKVSPELRAASACLLQQVFIFLNLHPP